MASAYSFRKALNGFNRDDVIAYIAHMNAQHESRVSQLTADLQQARSAQDNTSLVERIRQLEEQLAAAQTPAPQESWVEAELAAYRRAESAERHARDRVAQLMHMASDLTADASLRLGESAANLDDLTQQAREAVAALNRALVESQGVLQEVAGSIHSLGVEE